MTITRLFVVTCDSCDEEAPVEPSFTITAAIDAARSVGWWVRKRAGRHDARRGDALCPDCDHR